MGKRRKRPNANATGRNRTSRFVRLDYALLSSGAFRALSPNSRALLIELAMLFNGSNNGSLYLSVRDAASRMGISDLSAARKSFTMLEELGFIELSENSHFAVKASDKSRARCWRLTWEDGPGKRVRDSRFMECAPPSNPRARKRMERGMATLKSYRRARDAGRLPVLEIDTMAAFPPRASLAPV